MRNKTRIAAGILAALTVLTLLFTLHMFTATLRYDNDSQMQHGAVYPIAIDGEYSAEGGPWTPLTPQTRFENLELRDITIRGRFTRDLPAGELLYLKIEHVRVALRVNGEEIFRLGVEEGDGNLTDSRGNLWATVVSPGITTGDMVELNFGNLYRNAYIIQFDDLLWKMHTGDEGAMAMEAVAQDGWNLGIGLIFLILTLFLLIAALLCSLLHIPGALQFFWLGLTTLSSAVWFSTLSPALSFFLPWPVFLSILYAYSIQGIAASVTLFLACHVTGWRKLLLWGCIAAILMVTMLGITFQMTGVIDLYKFIDFSSLLDLGVAGCIMFCLLYETVRLKRRELLRLLGAMLPLVLGGMLELVNGYIQFSLAAVCWGVGLVAFTIMEGANTLCWVAQRAESEKRALKLENELIQSRIAIMLTQIQPHFLFNALTTIRYLCDTQPAKASEVVADFSSYLRGNMASLTQRTPISFEQELIHLNHYLAIEQLRFDEVQIVYHLQTTAFTLPALSVQPLVENAIRHGVSKRRAGGTVTIASWEDEQSWKVQIEDDGVGFPAGQPADDGRAHIGIQNVRQRLADQCGGSLIVESIPGTGTCATLTLPKPSQ